MIETNIRSIAKMITFKILTVAVTVPITGLNNALLIHTLTTICFYLHERAWNKVKWGRKQL